MITSTANQLDFLRSVTSRDVRRPRYTSKMPKVIKVPFERLVLNHREIGCHRGRRWGFREVFGFATLQNVPFIHLGSRVKRAYEGKDVPSHKGWNAQREALQWLVDRGAEGIYALDENDVRKGIQVAATPFRSYAITDGNHRALALYILNEDVVRAWLRH